MLKFLDDSFHIDGKCKDLSGATEDMSQDLGSNGDQSFALVWFYVLAWGVVRMRLCVVGRSLTWDVVLSELTRILLLTLAMMDSCFVSGEGRLLAMHVAGRCRKELAGRF